jgi:hypothetical protein
MPSILLADEVPVAGKVGKMGLQDGRIDAMSQWRLALAALLMAGCTKATDGKQPLCEEEACSGQGRCVVEDGRPRCECDPAYAIVGLTCVANCLEVSCSDRGGCIVVENEPWCVCDQGYWPSGLECRPDPPRSCAGQECSGHGVCVETENELAFCVCELEWVPFGLACVPASCQGVDCSSHGACVEADGLPWCRCDPGYEPAGLGCVPADCSQTDCSGHGACVEEGGPARCVCDHGYVAVGLECRAEACASEGCSGHGACVDEGGSLRCICDPGYVADDLRCRPGCAELDCSGHGACVQSGGEVRCVCDPGYELARGSCLALVGGGDSTAPEGGPDVGTDGGARDAETVDAWQPSCSSFKERFGYTGSDQSFVVPEGCHQIRIKAWGGGGGNTSHWSTHKGGGRRLCHRSTYGNSRRNLDGHGWPGRTPGQQFIGIWRWRCRGKRF